MYKVPWVMGPYRHWDIAIYVLSLICVDVSSGLFSCDQLTPKIQEPGFVKV